MCACARVCISAFVVSFIRLTGMTSVRRLLSTVCHPNPGEPAPLLPLPQQRLLSRGCSKRRRHRRFEIFILRLFSNCWSSYFYPSGGHYAFSQRSWAQRGIPFNRIEIMHSRLSPRWLLIKIIAGQPKRGSMNFG